MIPSRLALAMYWPSKLQSTFMTVSLWPFSSVSKPLDAKSHIDMDLSSPE